VLFICVVRCKPACHGPPTGQATKPRSCGQDAFRPGRPAPPQRQHFPSHADERAFAFPPGRFALYDFVMVSDDQVTDEQIQKWADEAEAGYDVEELKRRGRGRPGRGAEPMQVIAVRLTAEEIAALDAYAAREHLSRSEAIRRALAGYAA
jgi:hypothetical protein